MTSIVNISLMETQKDRDFKVVTIPSISGYKITKVARARLTINLTLYI